MRIVHVVPSYAPILGGAELYARAVSEGLTRRGHHVLVVTGRGGPQFAGRARVLAARERLAGVEVRRLRADRLVTPFLERLVRWPGGYRLARHALGEVGLRDPAWWSLGRRARGTIRRFRPDIVCVFNWYFAGLVAAIAADRPSPRTALVGVPLFHTEEAWSRRPGYPALSRRHDAMVVNTEHERRFVEALAPGGPAVRVAGVGVDPATLADRNGPALRARLGLGAAPVVGFLGRLDPSKGVVGLIDAMPFVWRAYPETRLVLAGRPFARGSAPFEAIAAALGRIEPGARARIVPLEDLHDRDKPSLLDALDVFAMPSISESFGIAYLEAWLCGKPVIGADVGSTPSVIRDGVDGLLVPPRDPRAIADAIVSLLADPDRRARMGEAGRERTVRERSWDRVVDTFASVYAGLVGASGRHAMLPPP